MIGRNQRNRRGINVGAAGLAGACLIGLSVAAAPSAQALMLSRQEPIAVTTQNKTTTIVENDGKRTVRIELSNDKVRVAEIDGASVPQDRIEHDGDTIRLKDENGAVVYEHVLAGGATTAVRAWSASPFGQFNVVAGRSLGGTQNPDAAVVKIETPKGMIGVQLVEPDQALRGHFGFKRGESSMVAAVYEGLPAAGAGLEPYDLIVGIDGKSPVSTEDVRSALRSKDPGTSVSVTIIKKGERRTVSVTPEKYDSKKLESAKRNAVASADVEGEDPFAIAQAYAGVSPGEVHRLGRLPVIGQLFSRGSVGDDTMMGVISGPDGKGHKQIFLQLGEEQRLMAERLREMAEEMHQAIQEKTERLHDAEEAHRDAVAASQDLEVQIKELEQSLQRLREAQQKKPGGVGAPPAPPAPPSRPNPPTPGDPRRDSFSIRAYGRSTLT